jgi:putative membrane protein
MSEFLSQYYLWLKAIHIIFVISWMAGMFYLPRLYVYHTQVTPGSEADEIFKVMERKLMRIIMNPAMIVAFITGILLIIATGAGAPGTGYWMHVKLVLVLGLGAVHGMFSSYRKAFERGENQKSEKFFRSLNEVPTVLMIAIVLLVVIKFI